MRYADSALFYDQMRRRRSWALGPRGLQGYAQYLAGGMGDTGVEVSSVIGAETAAMDSTMGDTAWRAITVGVTTGVLTFLLNRWLGKVLG